MNKLEELKKEYHNIEIPAELSSIVEQTIRQHKKKTPKKILIGVLVAASLFIASVNTSSTIAYALSDVPVVGKLVKLVTFREYHFNDETYNANLKVPAVTNLENKELEKSLNEKYLQ
ncbi:anti-sigma factor, partial [Bacillus sp. JJ722]